MSQIGGTQDSMTIQWFPKAIKFPNIQTEDYPSKIAQDMLHLLKVDIL